MLLKFLKFSIFNGAKILACKSSSPNPCHLSIFQLLCANLNPSLRVNVLSTKGWQCEATISEARLVEDSRVLASLPESASRTSNRIKLVGELVQL